MRADAHVEIEETAQKIFQEQFGWDVLSQFDRWKEDMVALKQRVRSLDELRISVLEQEGKVKQIRSSRSGGIIAIHEYHRPS